MGVRLDVEYIREELRKNAEVGVRPGSQAELATDAGLSKQMVSDLLGTKRGASVGTVRKLAKALDVLPRKLLCDAVTAQQSADTALDSGEAVPA